MSQFGMQLVPGSRRVDRPQLTPRPMLAGLSPQQQLAARRQFQEREQAARLDRRMAIGDAVNAADEMGVQNTVSGEGRFAVSGGERTAALRNAIGGGSALGSDLGGQFRLLNQAAAQGMTRPQLLAQREQDQFGRDVRASELEQRAAQTGLLRSQAEQARLQGLGQARTGLGNLIGSVAAPLGQAAAGFFDATGRIGAARETAAGERDAAKETAAAALEAAAMRGDDALQQEALRQQGAIELSLINQGIDAERAKAEAARATGLARNTARISAELRAVDSFNQNNEFTEAVERLGFVDEELENLLRSGEIDSEYYTREKARIDRMRKEINVRRESAER